MLKALPGEFLVRGHLSKKAGVTVRFAAGDGVDPAVAKRLQAYFDQPWFTLLNKVGSESKPQSSFLDELRQRGYDLSTLRFSVFLKTAGRKVPRNPGLISQFPGVLHARWALVEFDVPDVCSCWHRPCHRGDSVLFQNLLSMPTFTEEELRALELREMSQFRGMLDTLKYYGFDQRTLRFRVRSALPLHPDDLPKEKPVDPEAAKLVRILDDTCPAFVPKCLACGAKEGQACSEPDPDDDRLGIELGNRVHAGRLAP